MDFCSGPPMQFLSGVDKHELRQLTFHQAAQRRTPIHPADTEVLFGQIVEQKLALCRLVLHHHDVRSIIHCRLSSL